LLSDFDSVALPLLVGSAAVAQDQGEAGGRRRPMSSDYRLKQMTKDFNLTTDQRGKIKPTAIRSDEPCAALLGSLSDPQLCEF
jgi:hypothetical protein